MDISSILEKKQDKEYTIVIRVKTRTVEDDNLLSPMMENMKIEKKS